MLPAPSSRRRFVLCALLASILSSAAIPGWAATGEPALPHLSLRLTPVVRPESAQLLVDYRLALPRNDQRTPWRLTATQMPPYGRTTDQIMDLKVRDATGELTMVRQSEGVWRATRVPVDAVRVSYRVPAAMPNPPARGPQTDLQVAGGGLSGTGEDVLVLPEDIERYRLTVHWALPDAFQAVSSYGEGDITANTTRARILNAFFLVGRLYRYNRPSDPRLQVYGLGTPRYDLDALFHWASQWHQVMERQLLGASHQTMRVFFRSYDGGMSSASGYTPDGTVMLYLPPVASDSRTWSTRLVLAHEMIHAWMHGFGGDADGSAWYDEGMADYMAVVLPFRAGLYSPLEYLELINGRAATYYGNAKRSLSEANAEHAMWAGPDAWTTHYMRGFMYLADLDSKLRRFTHGSNGVIDLFNAMKQRQDHGDPVGIEAWRNALRSRGLPEANADLDHMLSGQVIFPAPEAFGPCVIGKPSQIGIFDPGYTTRPNGADGRIVTHVDHGSGADRAGLKPGDIIIRQTDPSNAFSQPGGKMELMIEGGGAHSVRFLPRTGVTTAMKWEWRPAIGDICRPSIDANVVQRVSSTTTRR